VRTLRACSAASSTSGPSILVVLAVLALSIAQGRWAAAVVIVIGVPIWIYAMRDKAAGSTDCRVSSEAGAGRNGAAPFHRSVRPRSWGTS
jgi:hypothetical protein